jgi:hypothetical protein
MSIPGPFFADGNTVYATDHGKLFTVARVNGARITDEAQAEFAAHIVKCVNAHDELIAALRDIARMPEGDEESAQAVARAVLAKVQS